LLERLGIDVRGATEQSAIFENFYGEPGFGRAVAAAGSWGAEGPSHVSFLTLGRHNAIGRLL
jgi:hypothetical protein